MMKRRTTFLILCGSTFLVFFLLSCSPSVAENKQDMVVEEELVDEMGQDSEAPINTGGGLKPFEAVTGEVDATMDTDCLDLDKVLLSAAPAEANDLAYIFPMGLMTNAHVTPVDHQYYYWDNTDVPVERYPIFSPADGYITHISFIGEDYRVIIEHSCDIYSIYIHLEQLAGPIAEYDGQVTWEQPVSLQAPVRAGDIIAFDGGTNGFDFSLHDETVILPGFINPESYIAEPWKVHTVDPYDYFDESTRSHLLEKNLRQVEPLGGKIDYDISGRLSGTWFVENTNGYAGIIRDNTPIKPNQQIGYWNTHLAIAPDPIDSSVTKVSFGWFNGQCLVGAIKPPHIAPSDISPETGIVKWELWVWLYIHSDTGEQWRYFYQEMTTDLKLGFGQEMYGTVLFQLLDGEHLKMETFPGKTASEVTGFTEKALIYTR